MCKFCENIGIGLPDWNFLPEDDAVIVDKCRTEIQEKVAEE